MQHERFKSIIIALAMLLGATALHAQPPGSYVAPLRDAASRSAHRFHFGVEYLGSAVWMKPDGLNGLGKSIGINNFKGPIYLNGFAGVFRYDGMLPCMMLTGGYHFGSLSRTARTTFNGTPVLRTATFSMGSAVGEIDIAAAESVNLSFLPGLAIGHDWYRFEMLQEPNRGDSLGDVINDEWLLLDPEVKTGRYVQFTARGFAIQPMANLEVHTYDAPMFKARIGVGYRCVVSKPEWRSSSGVVVADIPDIRTQGPVLTAGVALGLFFQ